MKPTILETRYVLAVRNLAASVSFYKEKLGFTSDWAQHGWHQLRREGIVVMLGECADDRPAFETRNHSYFAYIQVNGIEAYFEEFVANGVETIMHLGDKPWGMREFGIRTIDGTASCSVNQYNDACGNTVSLRAKTLGNHAPPERHA